MRAVDPGEHVVDDGAAEPRALPADARRTCRPPCWRTPGRRPPGRRRGCSRRTSRRPATLGHDDDCLPAQKQTLRRVEREREERPDGQADRRAVGDRGDDGDAGGEVPEHLAVLGRVERRASPSSSMMSVTRWSFRCRRRRRRRGGAVRCGGAGPADHADSVTRRPATTVAPPSTALGRRAASAWLEAPTPAARRRRQAGGGRTAGDRAR